VLDGARQIAPRNICLVAGEGARPVPPGQRARPRGGVAQGGHALLPVAEPVLRPLATGLGLVTGAKRRQRRHQVVPHAVITAAGALGGDVACLLPPGDRDALGAVGGVLLLPGRPVAAPILRAASHRSLLRPSGACRAAAASGG